MKKIAVISDIHGNIAALEQVIADIKRRNIDQIINLGDHISGPLWPKETIEFVMMHDWVHIAGNHDRQLIAQDSTEHGASDQYAYQFLNEVEKDWLRTLPSHFLLEKEVLCVHGTPSSDSIYLLETVENGRTRLSSPLEIKARLGETKFPVLLCGHSHFPRVVQVPGGPLIVNPGSIGLQAYSDDFIAPHVCESGSPHARYATLTLQENRWIVDLITIPYDFEKAVKQAKKNNRPDWAVALQSGYMHD